jgi:class 3 adenylate cyclase
VLHRKDDKNVPLASGRYLAEHIPGAKLVILPGQDHMPFWGDQEPVIGEIQQFMMGKRSQPQSDRVLLTILMTDIVGSTKKAAALGDLRWKDLLQRHDTTVRRELANYGGDEINTTGDGFLLAFAGPTRAVQCAQAIKRELALIGLNVRAGVHSGECERKGDDISGLAVHIASRIARKATAGTILVSGTVKDLVAGSGLKFVDRGAHILKGVQGEWPLFALVD